ncbi:MAG: SAM-dependent methyltransferase [Bacteroidales bacterium]|nr:SAM-dependent methyltransferase [Bacteroidales bacterium]
MKKEISDMLFLIRRSIDFACYRLATNHYHGHGIHSPFLFRMAEEVFTDPSDKREFEPIEVLHNDLLKDTTPVLGTDPGAGSRRKHKERTLGTFVRTASITPAYGRMLTRLVRFARPERIVEWGTGAGISTLYLALAMPSVPVFTVEGNPWLADRARAHFQKSGYTNIHPVTGLFEETFHRVLPETPLPCVFFIDGNHTSNGTMHIIERIMNHIHPESVIVLDDIRWSEEMYITWKKLISSPDISISIDLFSMGILLFRPGLWKQHFRIRF